MQSGESIPSPSSHTPEGGVLLGSDHAHKRMVLFEDPQCPYCRQFEEVCGAVLENVRDGGTLTVEYRMRCFLGPESVRAENALALAAEESWFDELRKALFSAQPAEGSGGFTTADLLALGRQVGLASPHYTEGVKESRYQGWVLQREQMFQAQDSQGTPAAWLDGRPVDGRVLVDPDALAALLRQ
jgi:protein-disulfide isomerase